MPEFWNFLTRTIGIASFLLPLLKEKVMIIIQHCYDTQEREQVMLGFLVQKHSVGCLVEEMVVDLWIVDLVDVIVCAWSEKFVSVWKPTFTFLRISHLRQLPRAISKKVLLYYFLYLPKFLRVIFFNIPRHAN